jgi:hypothetical protein
VTFANQFSLLRSHQATVMGADDIESADSRCGSKERVSNRSTRKVSCEEELRFAQDDITRLRDEVASATSCLTR